MGFGLHIGDYMFELDASEHLHYETFVYGTLLKNFLIHTLSVNEP